jgi:hypothetical protein
MTFWEQSNELGRLEILEVYEYFDRPVLLALRSVSDATYLAVLVDTDNNVDRWLCVAVSRLRFEAVRSGGVDLRTGFGTPEDDRAFLFDVPHDDATPLIFSSVRTADIANDWLPAPNVKLELPTDTLPALARDIKAEAVQRHRDLFDVKLEPVDTTRNEAPIGLVGRVLERIQETINALLPNESAELMFVAVGGGSFEMRLASADQIISGSAITHASQEFGKLLQLADDDAAFRRHVTTLAPEVADKYLTFLRAIEDRVTATTIEWASPNSQHPPGHAVIRNELVKSEIAAMVEIRDTRQFEVVGKLMTSSVRNNTFEFEPDEPVSGVALFTGKASAEALDPAKRNAPGNRFTATIEEIRKPKANNEVTLHYTLVRLTPA